MEKRKRKLKSQVPENRKTGLIYLKDERDREAIDTINRTYGTNTTVSAIRIAIRRVKDEIDNGNLITIVQGKK